MIINTSLFGTDGIRCHFGKGVFQKNELIKLAHAIMQWMSDHNKNPHILILKDTRASGDIIKTIFNGVGSLYHATFYDAGIMPTPAAPIIMNLLPSCSYALVLTASHNSAEYNGIKIINKEGCKIDTLCENIISTYFHALDNKNMSIPSSWIQNNISIEKDAQKAYTSYIHAHIQPCIHQSKTYLIDTAHGAYSFIAPTILKQLNVDLKSTGNMPTGSNCNKACGTTCISHLLSSLQDDDPIYRIAFDGDGDRTIVITPEKEIIDGDDILWYISHLPLFKNETFIVGTSMSNQGLADALKIKNQTLIRSAVGDKNVAAAMKQYGAMLGGEPSGHSIIGPDSYIADGLLAALLCIEAHQAQTIKPLVKWAQEHRSIALKQTLSLNTKEKLSDLESSYSLHNNLCRIVLRPSGTEPIIRLMVEHQDKNLASLHAKELESLIHALL